MIKSLGRNLINFEMAFYLKKALSEKREKKVPDIPRHILCLQMNAIGDSIISQPAWANLQSIFPEATIDLVCRPHVAPLFIEDPSLNAIFPFENHKYRPWLFKDNRKLKKTLLEGNYDLLIDFTALPLTANICATDMATPSIGFQRLINSPFGRFDLGRAYDLTYPYSETDSIRILMLKLVENYSRVKAQENNPELYLKNSVIEKAEFLLKKKGLGKNSFLVLHPGAKWPPKRWPLTYWRQLIGLLIRNIDFPIVVMGNKEDSKLINYIVSDFDDSKTVSFVSDRIDLSSAVIKMAGLCVSNDSAAMHIAASVKTKSIALFGPVSPDRSAPPSKEICKIFYRHMFCSPCTLYYSRDRCRRGINFCMYGIKPQMVYKEIKQTIG